MKQVLLGVACGLLANSILQLIAFMLIGFVLIVTLEEIAKPK